MKQMVAAEVHPDEATWNILLKAYVDGSDLAGAWAVMEEMRAAGVKPDKIAWNQLLHCHAICTGDTLPSAENLALQMEKEGLVLDRYAYSSLIRCCFSGRAAAHPHNPSQAKHWFSLYVSGWRNRGPLDPGIAYSFRKAVGQKVAADTCKNLGLDLGCLLGTYRPQSKWHGKGGTGMGAPDAGAKAVGQEV
jgi:pentatricopeptide repeat protein